MPDILSPDGFARVKELFLACVDRPPVEQQQHLDEACAGDEDLKQQVWRMLRNQPSSIAAVTDVVDPAACLLPPGPGASIGESIGPYKLMEQLGEGGMGIVYIAEQKTPVRRQVALKVIKPGMDTRQVVARFEAERQALSMMDHPHIARIFDGGTTNEGRPYFVMELVRGVPITDFCDDERLTIRQRLELFIQVCQAVQHAHQKGIIHRDLKPSNILVTRHDDTPVPKVIDFGIAKAVNQTLTDKTIYTQFAQFIGTPLYMSPEQAQLSGLDIDTRSDVYSLGVLLYELLTGTTPFDAETLKQKGLDEMRRIIREDEPPQPSQRISTLNAQAGSTISERRNVNTGRLRQTVRGELDWIVMRAMEKDRNRRYQSASELGDDVKHYLNDEPVEACPPSKWYRLRKYARQHQIALGTSLTILAAIVLASGISFWQAYEANQARSLADSRLRDAEESEKRSKASYERTRATIKQLLSRVAREEVVQVEGMKPLYQQLLKDAIQSYTDLIASNPNDPKNLVDRGDIFYEMKNYPQATDDFAAAVNLTPGDDHLHYQLSNALMHTFSAQRTKDVHERALRHINIALKSCPSRADYLLLRASVFVGLNRAADARNDLRRVEQIEHLTPNELCMLGRGYYDLGQDDLSLKYLRIAVERNVAASHYHNALGVTLTRMGKYPEALVEFTEAIRLDTRINAPQSRWAYDNRGLLYLKMKRYDEALADFNEHMKREPNYPPAYAARAAALFHLQRYRAALVDAEKFQRLAGNPNDLKRHFPPLLVANCPDPEFRRVMQELYEKALKSPAAAANLFAWVLSTAHDPKLRQPLRAIEHARAAVELEPTNHEFWRTLGFAQYRAGEWQEAIVSLEKAIALGNKGSGFSRIALSMAHSQLGHTKEACEWYSAANTLLKASVERGTAQLPECLPIYLEAFELIRECESEAKTVEYRETINSAWKIDVWLNLLTAKEFEAMTAVELENRLDSGPLRAMTAAKVIDLHQALRKRKWYNQAIAVLRVGQKQYPENYGINLELAYLLATFAKPLRPQEAVTFAHAALALEPNNPHAMSVLAYAMIANGQLDDSMPHLQEALRIEPGKEWASRLKIEALVEGNRADEALRFAQELVNRKPNSAASHQYLGIVLRRLQRIDEAIAAHRKAMELAPTDYSHVMNLRLALRDKGLMDEALSAARKAIELRPDDGQLYLVLGDALADSGKLKEAIGMFQLAVEKDSTCAATAENDIAWRLATWPDASLRDLPQALQRVEKALELEPESSNYLNTLGVVQYRLGDWSAAIRSLEKCLAKRTTHEIDHLFLAMSHWQLKHPEEARRHYDIAIERIKASKHGIHELREIEGFRQEAEELMQIKPE